MKKDNNPTKKSTKQSQKNNKLLTDWHKIKDRACGDWSEKSGIRRR